jgi:hypothetical protein
VITTYAISLSSVDRTERERIALIDAVTDWQTENYPVSLDEDDDTPGVSVRTRLASNDPVFRTTITESNPKSTFVVTTTATVSLLNGTLSFDLRVDATPRTAKITPHLPPLAPPHVFDLVRQALRLVPAYDAMRPIVDKVDVIDSELKGQEIGHFTFASGRNLPVVVEIADFGHNSAPFLTRALGPLVGLVHMARITTPDALSGYLEVTGLPLINPGTVVVHWAGRTEPKVIRTAEITPAARRGESEHTVRLIIQAAASSIAPPRIPPPPRDEEDDLIDDGDRDNAAEVQGDDDLANHVEQLEAMVNEMQGALSEAERIITDQASKLEKREGQVNQLVLRNLSLESLAGTNPEIVTVTTMAEALDMARAKFEFLIFHDRAIESGRKLEGPQPMTILHDLWRLNGVARRWSAGEISGSSLKSVCAEAGLNFSPGISDTARQKYEEDYLIDWNGRTVRAEAHIKRGKKAHLVRIHVYFDDSTHQVVVAYIGRHLRDKRSSS